MPTGDDDFWAWQARQALAQRWVAVERFKQLVEREIAASCPSAPPSLTDDDRAFLKSLRISAEGL